MPSRTSSARHPAICAHARRTACPLAFGAALVLFFVSLAALSGCSCNSLGHFDERKVVQQAQRYYADKYGSRSTVADIWEDRLYGLFGYSSQGRAFCTMADGTTVLVDFEKGALGDTRQQERIVDAYQRRLESILEQEKQELEDAGWGITLASVNGAPLGNDKFCEGSISHYTWGSETGEDHEGSFFRTRYEGDDEAFFRAEAPFVSFSPFGIAFEIDGKDARYEDAFPTSVPKQPAWQDDFDKVFDRCAPLSEDGPVISELSVYQKGALTSPGSEEAYDGLLGRRSSYENPDCDNGWLIVDWVPVGHGVYLTSDECGLRLEKEDLAFERTRSVFPFEQVVEGSDLDEYEARKLSSDAYETYVVELSTKGTLKLPPEARERKWVSLRMAYDNADPKTGLEQLGVKAGKLEPSLYTISSNPAAQDIEDAAPLEARKMHEALLQSGMQCGTLILYTDKPVQIVRM